MAITPRAVRTLGRPSSSEMAQVNNSRRRQSEIPRRFAEKAARTAFVTAQEQKENQAEEERALDALLGHRQILPSSSASCPWSPRRATVSKRLVVQKHAVLATTITQTNPAPVGTISEQHDNWQWESKTQEPFEPVAVNGWGNYDSNFDLDNVNNNEDGNLNNRDVDHVINTPGSWARAFMKSIAATFSLLRRFLLNYAKAIQPAFDQNSELWQRHEQGASTWNDVLVFVLAAIFVVGAICVVIRTWRALKRMVTIATWLARGIMGLDTD